MSSQVRKDRFVLEALEPRLMLSANAVVIAPAAVSLELGFENSHEKVAVGAASRPGEILGQTAEAGYDIHARAPDLLAHFRQTPNTATQSSVPGNVPGQGQERQPETTAPTSPAASSSLSSGREGSTFGGSEETPATFISSNEAGSRANPSERSIDDRPNAAVAKGVDLPFSMTAQAVKTLKAAKPPPTHEMLLRPAGAVNVSALALTPQSGRPESVQHIQSDVSGNIPDGTVWAAGVVQRIVGNATVPAGATLTIQPGAIIKFNAGVSLTIQGTLNAQGTTSSHIVFTSIKDDTVAGDTNGDGNTTTPAAGDRGQISLTAASSAGNLSFVEVRYAGGSFSAAGAVEVDNGHATLTDVQINAARFVGLRFNTSTATNYTLTNISIVNAGGDGLFVSSSGATIDSTNLSIQNVGGVAVNVYDAGKLSSTGTTISGTGIQAIKFNGGTITDARSWSDSVVYYLAGNVVVAKGATLTLPAGTAVKADSAGWLTIQGTLNVQGIGGNPVVFTSLKDDTVRGDTNGNAGATTPAAGDWNQIVLNDPGAVGNLSFLNVRYAGGTFSTAGALEVDNGQATLTNVQINSVRFGGLRFGTAAATTYALTNVSIANAGGDGLLVSSSGATVNSTKLSIQNVGGVAVNLYDAGRWSSTGTTISGTGIQAIKFSGGTITDTRSWNDSVIYYLAGEVTVGHGYGEGIWVYNGSAVLLANTISGVKGYGLRLESSNPVTATLNQITNAASGAMRIKAETPLTASGNTASGSGMASGIDVQPGTIADARQWHDALTYFIEGTLTISNTGSLDVQAGTILKFVYAGHGAPGTGGMVMNAPYNTSNVVDANKIKGMLAADPMPGQMFFVFDSCFSQSLGMGLQNIPNLRWNAAASSNETANDRNTYSSYLVSALRNQQNDLNGDGKVFISEATIAARTNNNAGTGKTPQSGGDPKVDQELHDDIGNAARGKTWQKAALNLMNGASRIIRQITNVFAHDPNEKVGPEGYGANHYIPNTELGYTIYFENDPKQANAPAQVVKVTDQLDANWDWSTFNFGPVTFGATTLNLSGTATHASGQAFLPLLDVKVNVDAQIDPKTGIATWVFSSLDPITGQPVKDPLLGFLPPDVHQPDGEGHVTYSLTPKAGLANQAQIKNQATIVFDQNNPIVTDQTLNTIDAKAPQLVSVSVNGSSIQRSHIDQIDFTFVEDTAVVLASDALQLQNLTTGQNVPVGGIKFTYDSTTQTGSLDLTSGSLPNGNYSATVKANGVRDLGGLPLAHDFQFQFHVLAGDANGDRVVNDLDLYRVWQNQLKPANARDLNDDLNGDGQVNLDDVNVVKQHYLNRLPALSSQPDSMAEQLETTPRGANGPPASLVVASPSTVERSAASGPTVSGVPDWTPQGPSPITGGQTAGLGSNPVSGAVQAIAVDPVHAGVIYIGSVNGGVGLLKTTDGGGTWTLIDKSFFDGRRISGIVSVSTAGGSALLVSTDDGLRAAGTPDRGYLFRSTDGGQTFKNVSLLPTAGLPTGSITDLEVDPGDHTRFYVALPGQGIYRSESVTGTDVGLKWTPIATVAAPAGLTQLAQSTRIELAVSNAIDPTTSDHPLYAAIISPNPTNNSLIQLNGLYRSANHGVNWQQVTNLAQVDPGGYSAINFFSIVADPQNPNVAYLAGDRQATAPWVANIYRTDAATNTWTSIVLAGANGTAPHADSHDLAFDLDQNGNLLDLLEADDGGIYRLKQPQNAATRQWVSLNGNLQLTQFYSVAYDPVNHTIFGGAQDVGSPEQQAAGNPSWTEVSQGDGGLAQIDASNPAAPLHYTSVLGLGTLSNGTWYSLLTRRTLNSQDQVTNVATVALQVIGANQDLFQVDSNLPGLLPGQLSQNPIYILNAADPTRMLVATNYLYESTTQGDTLTSLGGLVPVAGGFAPNGSVGPVTALAYGGFFKSADGTVTKRPEIAYVGANGGLLVRSSVGGAFNPVNTYPGSTILDIVLDATDWRIAYLLDSQGRVWRTTDAGASNAGWTNLTGNLGNLTQNLDTIELAQTQGTDVLLAGGFGGVFRLINPAANTAWTKFGNNLPNVLVTDLHYDRTDDVLVAATFGRGAWTIAKASPSLAQPGLLKVTASTAGDQILLQRDSLDPRLLDVFINSFRSGNTVTLASLSSIQVTGGIGQDTLTLDSKFGPMSVPGGIQFDGGGGNDTLVLQGPAPINRLEKAPTGADPSGQSTVVAKDPFGSKGIQKITFSHVTNFQDNLPAPATKTVAAIGGGLDVLASASGQWNDATLLAQDFPVLGDSLAQALNGFIAGQTEAAHDPDTAAAEGTAVVGNEGSQFLRRIIETGDGSFSLADVGENQSLSDLQALRAALDGLDGADGNVTLTQTGNTTLADVLDFKDAVRQELVGTLGNDAAQPTFATLQDLATHLAASLRVSLPDLPINYDPATHALTYHVEFAQSFDAVSRPLDFSLHAGTLASFSTSSTVSVTAAAGCEFDLGFDLTAAVTGDSLTKAIFIKSPAINGNVAVTASSINATAQIASFRVHVINGSASAKATISVQLKDPGTDAADGRLSLNELAGALTNISSAVSSPSIQITGSFSLPATADPFQFGGLTVALAGQVSGTTDAIDYSLSAAISGTFLNALMVLPLPGGQPSAITLTKAGGLTMHARARAFGVTVSLDGTAQSTENFSLTAKTDPVQIAGVTVTLAGSAFSNSSGSDFNLTATVTNWSPVSFLTIHTLTVSLDSKGLGFDTTTTIAGVDGVHLQGDYQFDRETYSLTATAPVTWTLISGVSLSNVRFTLTNRNADGSQGDTRVGAMADLRLFGTHFDVRAHVTSAGAWIAASPTETFSPVPGLSLDQPLVIATTYDFVLDTQTNDEVPLLTTPQNDSERQITTGVDLVATSRLPDNVPGVGGSEVQIAGMIGTDLSQMAIEAKLVLAHPPEIGGLLAFDSVGLRISGEPSLTVFGEGRILHNQIPGLSQDIAIRAALTLDLVHTTLSGSLSLLHELDNFFGVDGLSIIEADGKFGINFGTTPLPLPTVGFNLRMTVPPLAQTLLTLPPTLAASLNISTTEPILAADVTDWQPLARLGLKNLQIKEAEVVVAPSGGTIGLKTFPPGFSAAFVANLFGTEVNFQGRFDQQTKGIVLEAYVASFTVAGINITGAGPDGVYQDGKTTGGINDPDNDNGSYFKAALTADTQELTFSGRVNLPGQDNSGKDAFIQLTGDLNADGLKLDGQIQNWNVVPQVLQVNTATFTTSISFSNSDNSSLAFNGELDLLHTPISIEGKFSSQGLEFTGTLKSPGTFAGISVSQFTLSFSTVSNDQHILVDLQLDLPGSGGVTEVKGSFQDQKLTLDGTIAHWQPLTTFDFNGTLHAVISLESSALSLDFDVTGLVLGVSSHFVGSLSSSSRGFDLFAAGTITLQLTNGQKLVDLQGTIDIGKDSPFAVGLAADFSLPGTRSADVHLEGSIGASGFSLFGKVDNWVLVPGLAFDGYVNLHFVSTKSAQTLSIPIPPIVIPPIVVPPNLTNPLPKPGDSLSVDIDVSTSLLGSNLRLLGNVNGNGSSFDLNLQGHVHFGGPAVAGVSLDLDATLVTTTRSFPIPGKSYSLAFSGDLQLFAGLSTVRVTASLSGDSSGNWSMTMSAGVSFGFHATLDSVIDFNLGVTINGTLTFSSSQVLPTVSLSVKGSASASVSGIGKSTVGLDIGIRFDITAGKATIPGSRPKVKNGVQIVWNDYDFDTPEKDPAAPTVTVSFVPSKLFAQPGTLQIRGTDAPERLEITRVLTPATPKVPATDTLHVRAATGSGDWVQLRIIDTASVGLLDIDMAGGNDTVSIASSGKNPNAPITIPAIIRGGLGSDTISGPAGPGTRGKTVIYGNRENATDDSLDGDDVIISNGNNDQVFGGGGNDTITTASGNTTIVGGSGVNLINGTLVVRGSAGPDHIVVSQQAGSVFPSPFAPPSPAAILVQNSLVQGLPVTLRRIALDPVKQIEVDAGTGDNDILVQANVTLPTILNGAAGNDHIQAGGGPCTIHGGNGDDVLIGGPADNFIDGEGGNDTLYGGPGNNTLDGGEGNNIIHGGLGDNTIVATTAYFIVSEGGNDRIQGGTPAVFRAEVNPGFVQRSRVTSVVLQFNRDVSASLGVGRVLLSATNGVTIASGDLAMGWDATSNTATLTFPGLPRHQLPDGDYILTLPKAGVTDKTGTPLSADYQLSFAVLTGDANGDRVTNDLDLYRVWQNQLKAPAARDLNDDLNGDGQVNLDDVNLVKQHYLAGLPASALTSLGQAEPQTERLASRLVTLLGFRSEPRIAVGRMIL